MRRNTVLKKVGIVAAAATAAMIALSPLAFATDSDGDNHHGHHGHHSSHDSDRGDEGGETTNIYLEDESVERNQSNDCDFDQEFTNAGLLGVAAIVTQTQTDNCVNVGDGED
jgi:hypothetical protein